jgi:hypothetical protein
MNEQAPTKGQGWELAEALRKSAQTADDVAVSAVRLMQQAGRERDELQARIAAALAKAERMRSQLVSGPELDDVLGIIAALSGPASPPAGGQRCTCEYVDIGIGLQRSVPDPDCPEHDEVQNVVEHYRNTSGSASPPAAEPTPNPNGCRHCGVDRESHLQRHVEPVGWHVWVEPTDTQRKERMLAHRAAWEAEYRAGGWTAQHEREFQAEQARIGEEWVAAMTPPCECCATDEAQRYKRGQCTSREDDSPGCGHPYAWHCNAPLSPASKATQTPEPEWTPKVGERVTGRIRGHKTSATGTIESVEGPYVYGELDNGSRMVLELEGLRPAPTAGEAGQ